MNVLHSPSRCMAGMAAVGMYAGLADAGFSPAGPPPSPSCGCSCRRCRRDHANVLEARERPAAIQGPPTLDEAYSLAGVWHLDDDCETCDERAAAAREGEW